MQKLFNRTAGKYIAMLFVGARAKQFHKGMTPTWVKINNHMFFISK